MSNNQEISFDIFDEQLLDLYNEQFKFDSFKTMIKKKSDKSNELINHFISNCQDSSEEDVNFKVVLSDELKESYKKGLLKFDHDKDGNLYAQLRQDNGRYGKKLNIEEDIKETDLVFAAQLNTIKDVLVEIVDTLENIEECVNEIISGLHNDRIGLYYSGISTYLEALQTKDPELKRQLTSQALKALNDSQAQIIQEFKSDVSYLKSSEFQNIKKKKHDRLVEKMNNIHECYQCINRIIALKAMIYFDNSELSAMMIVCTEYQRFIDRFIKPNSSFLVECDPKDDKLINGIWKQRANAFIQCTKLQNAIRNQQIYIEMEKE